MKYTPVNLQSVRLIIVPVTPTISRKIAKQIRQQTRKAAKRAAARLETPNV